MTLKTLKLNNFRSYKEAGFEFSPESTVIVGPNGSGKTNIIEAIYVLGMTKGWRGQSRDLIRSSSEWMRLEAEYGKNTYQVKMQPEKNLSVDGKEYKPQNFLGKIPVVLFEPSDIEIIGGSPLERRKFIDTALSALDKQYMKSLIKYRRVLRQRNHVLRNKPLHNEQVFAWDLLLAREAGIIVEKRHAFINYISDKIDDIYKNISGSSDSVGISYRGIDKEDYTNSLLESLKNNLRRDSILGSTSVGPHRDDLGFSYNSHDFTLRGSRGETRSLVVALKILHMQYIRSLTGNTPILLLDDVFSELDEARQINTLQHRGDAQTIISTTHIPKTISKPHLIKLR